jgi:hypothetical protein
VVVTRAGKKITGVEQAFDNFSARLVDLVGEVRSFQKEEVTSMKREFRSLMPDSYRSAFAANELDDLVAYLARLDGKQVKAAGPLPGKTTVPAQSDPNSWVSYGKNYAGWRYSPLTQINTANVARLSPAWILQGSDAGNETTPLVYGGVMYLTGNSNRAWALDARTGKRLWSYGKTPPKGLGLCCGEVNRGFAAAGDRLFKVNIEDTLVALDPKTGAPIWESTIEDYKKGYSGTLAPLAVKIKSWWGRPAPNSASAVSWMRTTRPPASAPGGSILSPARASPAATPGEEIPGCAAAAPPGSPAPTIRS